MIQKIIIALFMMAFLTLAFKLAIIVLVIAGLIFRTKETIGLLALGGVINGFSAHPLIGIGLTVLFLGVSLYFKHKEQMTNGTKLLPGPDD